MDGNFLFLNFEGLDDSQVKHLNGLLHPSNLNPEIEFPWTNSFEEEDILVKGASSSLNVHAPVFETYVSKISNHASDSADPHYSQAVSLNNGPVNPILNNSVPLMNYGHNYSNLNSRTVQHATPIYSNGSLGQHTYNTTYNQSVTYCEPPKTVNGDLQLKAQVYTPAASTFKLNPAVSCFVPSSFQNQQTVVVNSSRTPTVELDVNSNKSSTTVEILMKKEQPKVVENEEIPQIKQNGVEQKSLQTSKVTPEVLDTKVTQQASNIKVFPEAFSTKVTLETLSAKVTPEVLNAKVTSEVLNAKVTSDVLNAKVAPEALNTKVTSEAPSTKITTEVFNRKVAPEVHKSESVASPTAPRSWADIVSRGQNSGSKTTLGANKVSVENGDKTPKASAKEEEAESLSVEEDKLALVLGKYLHQLPLDFKPVFLQPRGLINRRNWCYINATLQALLACPPFYTLLHNLPLTQGLERGKSATPVIDSMMKVAQEISPFDSPQEELQPGQPFQPDFIYDMLRDLKSDCLKGQQEDAEEFLSFILNGMHEEMVKIIKNYEKKNHLDVAPELKENGDASEGEDEWQVIGSKHKGMVTRKVAEHKTPISDLLGGQIKSFLTANGSKTSASIQPFFTLQLDIQSESVTSVSEALKEMTQKEPIQGYTCAKTKQEIEAYSHVALQKLPPILILHLKRFVYNKTGGCKKVMKKTDYPIELELNKELFSSDVKKNQRIRVYKLFAVMYHDGEEAIKGHYISDVYNHGSQTWVRCDDRTISVVSEAQVLSHSPPRVPYLLFYQES